MCKDKTKVKSMSKHARLISQWNFSYFPSHLKSIHLANIVIDILSIMSSYIKWKKFRFISAYRKFAFILNLAIKKIPSCLISNMENAYSNGLFLHLLK